MPGIPIVCSGMDRREMAWAAVDWLSSDLRWMSALGLIGAWEEADASAEPDPRTRADTSLDELLLVTFQGRKPDDAKAQGRRLVSSTLLPFGWFILFDLREQVTAVSPANRLGLATCFTKSAETLSAFVDGGSCGGGRKSGGQ